MTTADRLHMQHLQLQPGCVCSSGSQSCTPASAALHQPVPCDSCPLLRQQGAHGNAARGIYSRTLLYRPALRVLDLGASPSEPSQASIMRSSTAAKACSFLGGRSCWSSRLGTCMPNRLLHAAEAVAALQPNKLGLH